MTERVLTLRELNRATLSRQMLLRREEISVPDAISRLAGLQAQVASPPYVGLWSRVRGFRREDLTTALTERRVVRTALMRSTLHLMTAEDFAMHRNALRPALERALKAFFGKQAAGLDVERLVTATRGWLEKEPKNQGELRELLAELEPGRDPAAMSYAVRTFLPKVQVPSGSRWGYSNRPPYALPEPWLGVTVSDSRDPRPLFLRYLSAFGPASIMDFQTWSGLTRTKQPLEALKPELLVYGDEKGNELLDLPDAPVPPEETPAPVRFVPDYDNLVLSHADRTRVLPEEHRSKVLLSAGRVRATILVDGFVRGAWKIEKKGRAATLVIEPFELLSSETKGALGEEGERLVRFVEDGAKTYEVRISEP